MPVLFRRYGGKMSLSYILPLLLVVLSNTAYQLLSKKIPSALNPFAGLMVTYAVGFIISTVMFFLTCHTGTAKEFSKVNICSFLLGAAIVGLEGGFLLMYRNGWELSRGSLTANILLAIVLVVIGMIFFRESMTVKKAFGIALCIIGVFFVNI